MWSFQFIKGLSVGLEYVEAEEMGFVVNMDLGTLRVTWYRDLIED
jgi:hypothetical protein